MYDNNHLFLFISSDSQTSNQKRSLFLLTTIAVTLKSKLLAVNFYYLREINFRSDKHTSVFINNK